MASPRYLFGSGVSDFAIAPPSRHGGFVVSAPSLGNGTLWSAATGGTQYTDLQTVNGGGATSVSTDKDGALVPFYGPPGVDEGWLDFGGGGRSLVVASVGQDRHVADLLSDTSSSAGSWADGRWGRKDRQPFNVKDYGATGDGVTDDAPAIRATIAAAAAAGGGEVIIQTGTYVMLTRATLPTGVTVQGRGTPVLKATVDSRMDSTGTVSNGYFFYAGPTTVGAALRGLTFDATAIYGGIAFIDRSTGVTVSRCSIVSTGGLDQPVRGVMVATGTDVEVSDCTIDRVQYGVFVYGGGDNIRILRNRVTNTGGDSVRVLDDFVWASNVVIDGNYLVPAGGAGSGVHTGAPSGSFMLTDFYRNMRVTNNVVIGAFVSRLNGMGGNNDLLSLRGMKNAVVVGNRVEGGGDLGICVENSEDVTVSANIARLNEVSGIVVHKSKRVSVTGNTCVDNCTNTDGSATPDAIRAGIRVMAASDYVTVVGNTCTDSRAAGSKTQLYGVAVWTGSGLPTNVSIGKNNVTGNVWGGYYTDNPLESKYLSDVLIASSTALPLEHLPLNTQLWSRTITGGTPATMIADRSGVTTTSAAAASGDTTVSSSGAGTLTANLSVVGVLLDSGVVHWATVTAQSGSTLTLSAALPSAAASGNVLKYVRYRTIVNFALSALRATATMPGQSIPATTLTPITAWTTALSGSITYNAATGEFTPSAGRWLINAQVAFDPTGAGAQTLSLSYAGSIRRTVRGPGSGASMQITENLSFDGTQTFRFSVSQSSGAPLGLDTTTGVCRLFAEAQPAA